MSKDLKNVSKISIKKAANGFVVKVLKYDDSLGSILMEPYLPPLYTFNSSRDLVDWLTDTEFLNPLDFTPEENQPTGLPDALEDPKKDWGKK